MAMGMWCGYFVMRVPIGEPQTTVPSPDSLKLRPLEPKLSLLMSVLPLSQVLLLHHGMPSNMRGLLP